MDIQLEKPIVFIDLETTGTRIGSDRIVDMSFLKVYPDGKEEIMSTLINPNIPIPPESTEIHGITDNDVKGKPTFKEYAGKINEFLDGCDVGGFGVKKFDLPLLDAEFSRNGVRFEHIGKRIVDAMIIYYKLEPRDLQAAYKRYCGKELKNAHKSMVDVKASFDVLKCQIEKEDIPRDIGSLHKFCSEDEENWIDAHGKFIWKGNDAVINFGPHKGMRLKEMCEKERGFLEWMLKKDFSSHVVQIVQDALNGKFPDNPKTHY